MKLVQYSTRDKRRINSDKTASEISISLGNKWCNGGLKGPIKKTFSNGNLYFSAVGPKQRDSVETKKNPFNYSVLILPKYIQVKWSVRCAFVYACVWSGCLQELPEVKTSQQVRGRKFLSVMSVSVSASHIRNYIADFDNMFY